MGLRAWRVDAPQAIQDAVQEALKTGEPGVIEVMIDSTVLPPVGDRVETIAGFKGK
ncbi:hypothetical protein [Streptomyces sp. NBC_00289]|uniref:hypothetical protein n=1 Tax=Streptomyces sp. NBC_00289 TaxID=2975703 RepID=UPI00352D1E39